MPDCLGLGELLRLSLCPKRCSDSHYLLNRAGSHWLPRCTWLALTWVVSSSGASPEDEDSVSV